MFTQANILVTGGTGSLGYELIRQLLTYNPRRIVVFARNESAQVLLKRTIDDPRLTFRIGDIRDIEALVQACQGIDYLFHLAALKHVPVCEEQPIEALKTNVIGTQNVIKAAIYNKVKKVINMSTDKAADPSNFYGMTKAIGEKLVILSNHPNIETKFICVRGGNILGTSGSVLQVFKKQMEEQRQLCVTDFRMSRFFMTQQEVSKMLIDAAVEGIGGEIMVMPMPACRIRDLAEVLVEASGEKDIRIVETGIRPGEKINELLLSDYESQHAVKYKGYIVVLPTLPTKELTDRYAECPPVTTGILTSNDVLMEKEEIRRMLARGGFTA